MRLLLDAQAFIYFILNAPALSTTARSLISDRANTRHLSVASVWEIAIKVSIGKLQLAQPLGTFIAHQVAANALTILPITVEHAVAVATLPLHHRDPFDRLLVAQSLVEDLTIVSGDRALDLYAVRRLW